MMSLTEIVGDRVTLMNNLSFMNMVSLVLLVEPSKESWLNIVSIYFLFIFYQHITHIYYYVFLLLNVFGNN